MLQSALDDAGTRGMLTRAPALEFSTRHRNGLCVIAEFRRRLAMEDLSRLIVTQEEQNDASRERNAKLRKSRDLERRFSSTGLRVNERADEGFRVRRFFSESWGAALKVGEKRTKVTKEKRI